MVEAVEKSLSRPVSNEELEAALAEYRGVACLTLSLRLSRRLAAFSEGGMRDVQLADEIEKLRMVLAARPWA